MHLRVTIDDQFTITAAMADYDAAPYNQECTAIAPDYRALVGMNLLRNFRQAVKDRFGRTDRKSVEEGKSVSVRVDHGGRSIIKKKQKRNVCQNKNTNSK